MKRQKKIRNIKYKDIINLNETLAKFILPRLKFFRKKTCTSPPDITLEEWKDILDKMILSFKFILDTSEPNFGELKFNKEKTDNGHWKMIKDPSSTFDTEAYIKWKEDKDVLKEDKEVDDEWVKFVKEMDKEAINERFEKIKNEIADINKSIKIILLMMEHPKTWPDYLEISEKMNSIQKKMSDIKAQQIWDKFQKEHNL